MNTAIIGLGLGLILTAGHLAIPAIALSAPTIVQPAKAKTVKIGDTVATVKSKLGEPESASTSKLVYKYKNNSETIEFTLDSGKVTQIKIQCQGQCG